MPALLARLQDQWPALATGTPPPVSGTVLGVDRAAVARVTMVLFAADGTPVAVAKCGRAAGAEQALVREHEALRRLGSQLQEPLRGSIPAALLLDRVAGRLVLVQAALPGRPMTTAYYAPGHTSDPSAVAADFTAAGQWLDAFQARTAQPGGEPLEVELKRLKTAYRDRVGWSVEEAQLFQEMADRAAAMAAEPLPTVAVHGDFWPGNLLVGRAGLSGVVDWELARPSGHPYRDVLKFPMSYAFYLDRSCPWTGGRVAGHPGREDLSGRWRRFGSWPNLLGFGHAWFGAGWFPEQVRAFVEQREQQQGLTPLSRSVLFPAFLAEQALTLDVEQFREGYRCALRAFAAERESSWVWNAAA
ncbi:MAG: hypothetical protein JWN08_1747 [Frankiales bacterium]|nr:hypothetical protein [Frankiales bacterium]